MKSWGWISMRRSLGDTLKNAFKETSIKNVLIEWFKSFKWRNRVQNQNLLEKIGQDRPYQKFWLLVKDQCNKFKSMIRSKSTISTINNLNSPSQVTDQAVKALLSYDDVSMMWTKANVAILACLMTWQDDVIRWRQSWC